MEFLSECFQEFNTTASLRAAFPGKPLEWMYFYGMNVKETRRSPNWARYAMNGALISIGVFKPSLEKFAIEAEAKSVKRKTGIGNSG